MREIKFRAWDKKNKKWLLGYEYPNLGGFSLFGECMLMGDWSNVLNEYILNCERYGHDQMDLIVMQFTGLLDKNGKEIYESDRLRHEGWEGSGVVTWEDGGFWVEWDSGYYTTTDLIADSFPDECEVIGNIYDSKEIPS